MDEVTARGGCQCGAVRWEARGPLREVLVCHCQMCRHLLTLGAAFSAVPPANLAIDGGRALRWYRSSPFARRGFCSKCGTALFWAPAHERHVSISAGSFDDPSMLVPGHHLYPDQKTPWYDVPPADSGGTHP
jgi:hypothetical protein